MPRYAALCRKGISERRVVVWAVTRMEDGKSDALKVLAPLLQLFPVNGSNLICRIAESAASKRRQYRMFDATLDQRVQLCCHPLAARLGREPAAVAKVFSCCTEFEEGKEPDGGISVPSMSA